MFSRMESEREGIIDRLVEISYFMRGAVQYDSMFVTTAIERQRMVEFIEKRLEVEAKKMYPQY